MAAQSPSHLAFRINALLSGEKFFEHWRDKFRDPQVLGTTLKCRCPFHLGEGFRSFLIDLRQKTFRCTFKQCKAARGGTLVDLHALLTDKPLLEAIVDIRSIFALEMTADLRADLALALADRARRLVDEKKLDAAEKSAVLALKENPTSLAIRLLVAEICEKRGRYGDARPYYQSALDEAVASKDWERAAAMLDRLRALGADDPSLVEQEALVAEARGERRRAVAAYLELAGRAETPLEQRLGWLEKALTFEPDDPEVIERLAVLKEEAGDAVSAASLWQSLAERYRDRGDPGRALDAIENVVRLAPDRSDAMRLRADILRALGRVDEAAEMLRRLALEALEGGSPGRAEQYLRFLCDMAPDDAESRWCLVTLLEATGRIDEATAAAEALFAAVQQQPDSEYYVETLKRLKKWRPDNIVYRERLAQYYAQSGDSEAALAELRELAQICFASGLAGDALEHVRSMREIAGEDDRKRMEIARFLAEHGRRREALIEYEAIAQRSLSDDPDLAEQACHAGLAIEQSRPLLHDALLQIYLERQPERCIEQLARVVAIHRSRGEADRAIALAREVKQRLPERIEPRLLLAELAAEKGLIEQAVAEIREIAERDLSAEQICATIEAAEKLVERHGDRVELLQVLVELRRCQGDRRALVEALLRLAEAQRQSGMAEAAEATYLEVFAVQPDEPRALLGHAELVRTQRGFAAAKPLYQRYVEQLLSLAQTDEAVRVYMQCVEWAPEDVDMRRALAVLLAEQGEIEEARSHWETAATTYLTVHDNPAAAAECYEAILLHFPDDVEAQKSLARLHALAGNSDAAARAFEKAARRMAERGDIEGQVGLYRLALDSLPGNGDLTRRLAEALASLGRREEAVRVLEDFLASSDEEADPEDVTAALRSLLELAPDQTRRREQLASLLAEAGDREAAAEQYRIIAEGFESQGAAEQAVEARVRIKRLLPEDVENRKALAKLHRARNDVEALKAELDELAAVWRHRGENEAALSVMEERLGLDPDDLEHRVALAEVRERAGRSDEAVAEYCRLGEIFAQRGDADRASEMVEKALRLRPGDYRFRRKLIKLSRREQDRERVVAELVRLAEAFFKAGETDEALDCCRQIVKTARRNPELLATAARLYAQHGYGDRAHEAYGRALQACERARDSEKALALLERAVADLPEAEDFLRRKLSLERDMGRVREAGATALRLARLLRSRSAPADEVASLYREAMESVEPTADALSDMADFYVEIDDIDQAATALRRLARLHEASGDIQAAIATLDRLYSLRPADKQTVDGLARLYEESGESDKARSLYLRFAEQKVAVGEFGEARSVLESVLDGFGRDEQTLSRLVECARSMGDGEAEKRYMDMLTEHLEERGMVDKAIRACEKAVERAPMDWVVRRKLADLYGRRGDGDKQVEVLAEFARACEKAGEQEKAVAARLQIRTLDPDNVENLVALGEAYDRAGRPEDAVGSWREAFDALARTDRWADAVGLGERLLEVDPAQDEVREKVATILAEHDESERAAELFSQLGRRLRDSERDRALEAFRRALQLQSRRAADRRSLAELMAESGDAGPAVSEYIQAAQDYAKAGDRSNAAECLEAALSLQPDNRLAREMLVQLRLDAGEAARAVGEAVAMAERALAENRIEDAERVLLRAAETDPAQARLACERLADLYISQGRSEEALRQLAPLVELARRESDLARLAVYLEKICDLVPIDHEHRAELVEIHLERGALRKALDHFAKLLPTLARLDLRGEAHRVGREILAKAGDDWEIKERVARTYARAQMDDLAVMTYVDLATAARDRGQYEHVVDYASSAVALDPRNVAASEMLLEAYLALGHRDEAFRRAIVLCEVYEERDEVDEALKLARKMVELLPNEPASHEHLSKILERHGRHEQLCRSLLDLADLHAEADRPAEAIKALERYLAVRPDDVEVRKRVVELAARAGKEAEIVEDYAALIAAAIEAGDSDEASRLFKRALEVDGANLDLRERWVRFLYDQEQVAEGHQALLALADMLVERGDVRRAAELVGEMAARFPDEAVLHSRLGDLHMDLKAKGRALQCYKKAAALYSRGGDVAAANSLAEKILQIDPWDMDTRTGLIDSLISGGQTERALEHSKALAAQCLERNLLDLAEREYRRIVSHEPDNLTAWQRILEIVEQMGRQGEHVPDYLIVADLQARRGLLEEAVRTYRKAIQLDPENIEARRACIDVCLQVGLEKDLVTDYLELADLLAARGQAQEAVELYRRVVMLEPDNPQANYQLKRFEAVAGERQGEQDGQRQLAAKAAARPPSLSPVDEKAIRDAVENYRQILKSRPENAMVRTRMADLLYQLGQVEEALDEWDRASALFFERGELDATIRVCEKILKIDPKRKGVRDRLSRASLKRDSMAAIESAIESLEEGGLDADRKRRES